MRNKTLLILALSLLFVCVFAFFASAEEETTAPAIPEWTETQTIASILPKEGFDTTSRVMLKNSDGSYVVYPSYYILKCTDTTFHNFDTSSKEFDFGPLNTAVADTTGETYSFASVVRLEIPSGFVTIQEKIFRKDKGFTSIMTLKVPEGVTSMGTYNFSGSESIQEIELPNSLTNIVANFASDVTSLRKVVMKGAVNIGASAFASCSALETAEWGTSLETIGDYAFDYCGALTGKLVASSLTSIGKCSFRETSVTEVTFGGGFTTVGTYVFDNCDSLVKLTLDGDAGVNMCKGCDNLKTVVFGENARTIGEYAFVDCPALETATLHDSITTIGKSAFLRDSALSSVSVPKSLVSLGAYAFSGCTSLSGTVVLPETLTTVGDNVFNGCSNIQKAIIKCNTISSKMFINCSKLSTLVLTKDITAIGSEALSSVVSGKFLTIYTGNDPERLGTLYSNDRFKKANLITYEQYLLDIENGVTYSQNTIVYGADYCVELNAGVHTMNDTPTCVLPSGCIKCDLIDEPALGHERKELLNVVYVAFDQNGNQTFSCTRCEDEILVKNGAKPIFGASGYSYSRSKTSLIGGFTINWNAYDDYIGVGGSALRFGLIAVNALKFADGEELLVGGILNSDYGFQVEMTSSEYSVFSCSIDNFSADARENLNLIITLYVINGDGTVSYIQSDSDYVKSTTVGTKTFDTVTLSLVIANIPAPTATTSNGNEEE